MVKRVNKSCVICKEEYTPTGPCSKYCPVCRPVQTKILKDAAVKNWQIRKGLLNGMGSGSSTGFGEDNPSFKHGKGVFDRWAKERLEELGKCERCDKPLVKDGRKGTWAGHHKDHNENNNVKTNLEILCRRCHAIEHECWKAFEGVTTKVTRDLVTGRYKRIEAPDSPTVG